GSSKSKCSVVDDVIYSFFANHKIDQHLVYEDLDQMNKEDFEEYDLKHHMVMLSIKKYKTKEAGKDGSDSKAMVIDWVKQTEEGNTKRRSLENFDMVARLEIASDADSEGEVVSANDAIPVGVSVSVGDVTAAVVSPRYEIEFALMGLSTEMVYGKKATDSSEIKTNDDSISHSHDSIHFDFSDRSLKPSTNDFQTCNSSQECSRPNHSDHDSNDSISSVSAPASESRDTIVIDCARQEDFPSICTSSIETDVKSSKTFCNKFGSFNKESHFRKHKSVTSKSCYVCGSYLHLIKDCDLHEQRLVKRNAEGKGKLGRRPTGKPVNLNRPKPVVFACQPNPVSAGKATLACNIIPLSVSIGNGILGPRSLNIQSKSTYFHSFTHNNQQIIFPITYNSLYLLYMTGGLNGKTAVKPLASWPWTK
nr:hypothetical protein [Tanacetum cinerariifolium]